LAFVPITNNTAPLWDTIAHAAALFPGLSENGLMAYSFFLPASENSPPIFGAIFVGVNVSSDRVGELLSPIEQYAKTAYPTELFLQHNISNYPTLYEFWSNNPDTGTPVGVDLAVGSRLLDAKALRSSSFQELFMAASASLFLVSGPGVHARDTSFNAVNPAWRTAYVHSTTGAMWAPFNETQKVEQRELLDKKIEALRTLAPDTGAYVNEADAFEPDFQHVFWGENYPKLLAIKRKIDPTDLLWCRACVGNERWEEVGIQLCRK